MTKTMIIGYVDLYMDNIIFFTMYNKKKCTSINLCYYKVLLITMLCTYHILQFIGVIRTVPRYERGKYINNGTFNYVTVRYTGLNIL